MKKDVVATIAKFDFNMVRRNMERKKILWTDGFGEKPHTPSVRELRAHASEMVRRAIAENCEGFSIISGTFDVKYAKGAITLRSGSQRVVHRLGKNPAKKETKR